MKVKLRDIVDGLEMQADEMSAYLNKRTGELVPTSTEDLSAAEEEEDLDDYSDWQRESILKAKEILGSEDWIELPGKFEINDYAIMEEFCRSIANPHISDRLLSTTRGSGAFGRFRGAVDALDLRQEWFDFRATELERIAVDWLEVNEIEFTREGKP
ncbi:MAG TPA: UPF0158 family protein [Pyrinomonadaceae bacterium]|nr:UPF0158 family protein [Pyrinomonadaceae bacterium]